MIKKKHTYGPGDVDDVPWAFLLSLHVAPGSTPRAGVRGGGLPRHSSLLSLGAVSVLCCCPVVVVPLCWALHHCLWAPRHCPPSCPCPLFPCRSDSAVCRYPVLHPASRGSQRWAQVSLLDVLYLEPKIQSNMDS